MISCLVVAHSWRMHIAKADGPYGERDDGQYESNLDENFPTNPNDYAPDSYQEYEYADRRTSSDENDKGWQFIRQLMACMRDLLQNIKELKQELPPTCCQIAVFKKLCEHLQGRKRELPVALDATNEDYGDYLAEPDG